MCPAVPSAAEGYLHDPTFGGAFRGVIEYSFLVEAKEDFLDDILGFTAVIQNAKSNRVYQSGMPAEELVQSLRILGLEASHEFFIAGGANLHGLERWGGVLPLGPPYYGECQRSPIQRRTHFQTASFLDGKFGTLSELWIDGPHHPSVTAARREAYIRLQIFFHIKSSSGRPVIFQKNNTATGTNLRTLPYPHDRRVAAISFLCPTGPVLISPLLLGIMPGCCSAM